MFDLTNMRKTHNKVHQKTHNKVHQKIHRTTHFLIGNT